MMKLEEIIAVKISASMLERVVFDQDIVSQERRESLFKPSDLSAVEIAQAVIESYGSHASKLAYGLFEQIHNTDWGTAELLFEHFKSKGAEYHNHQASLVGRIPTLHLGDLNDFLNSVKSQICLIVACKGSGPVTRGTGFLVGPDLVLTCKHVLKDFPEDTDITLNRSRVEIYFDFWRGEQVDSLDPDLPGARRVQLATNWFVASSPATDPDGVLGDLSEADRARIGDSLDFVLVRLAEKVGLQPLERGGGKQRRWIDLSTSELPKAVEEEDWIIIPQHPNGFPQRIDLGRFRVPDQTNTRLRYDTNTAPGTSGAPCFNHKFRLVGVHNARVGPEECPLYNQAIRATCIAPLLRKHLDTKAATAGYVLRWSVARDQAPPRVILGREKLLTWLQSSAAAEPKSLADRVYVAHTNFQAAGCSFSIEVLNAETRDSTTPRVIYGACGQQLPSTAEDFLLSLLRELGIGSDDISMPRRPQLPGVSATGIGEVDKLERWLSQELPEWLGNTIEQHVRTEIDAREAAKEAVVKLKSIGVEIPEKLQATADSPTPVIVRPNAWNFAYVAFDDLRTTGYSAPGPRTELCGELCNLIAALVWGKSDAMMHSGLRRLRWLFLGYLPDFVPGTASDGGGATLELLDPATVGVNEVIGIFERMSQAHLRMKEASDLAWRVFAKGVVRSAAKSEPHNRLASLERETSAIAADFLAEMEG